MRRKYLGPGDDSKDYFRSTYPVQLKKPIMTDRNASSKTEFLKPERLSQKGSRIFFSVLFGGAFGALGGWLLAGSLFGDGQRLTGAIAGALVLGAHEGFQESRRRRGQPRAPWTQLGPDFFFGIIIGWALDALLTGQTLIVYGVIIGLLRGILGFQLRRLVLAAAVGVVFGLALTQIMRIESVELLGALIWPSVRIVWFLFAPQDDPFRMVGDQVPPEEARYVVPFEANTGTVGTEYLRDLARTREGQFKRNSPGIGLVDSFDVLRGPTFKPELVDPAIVNFYEHTSDYSLSIVPDWDWRYKPLFWGFKRFLAQPIGQANLPFNTEEAQRGIVSYIDTIDFTCDDIIDLRGWIRAYQESMEAIYVGIYTTVRHEDVGYISVGFPLPDSTFTATLLPYNNENGNFLLKTRDTGGPYPGHYLTSIDKETGALGVVKVSALDEEIHVYMHDGELKVNHKFFLSGLNFLTLYYAIHGPK